MKAPVNATRWLQVALAALIVAILLFLALAPTTIHANGKAASLVSTLQPSDYHPSEMTLGEFL